MIDVISKRWYYEIWKFYIRRYWKYYIIRESNVNHERVLNDLYHTESVGHIDLVSSEDHRYLVNDMGKKVDVIIYSKNDVDDFRDSLLPILTMIQCLINWYT